MPPLLPLRAALFLGMFSAGLCPALVHAQNPSDYFVISVVDDETGRGVPLVELKTTSNVRYFTDSNGLVAFKEPGLMDTAVYFYVKSDGYEFPKDMFGKPGKTLTATPGGVATLKLKRINIAERLYRVTGEGIYRDTVLAGHKPPTKQPLLNARVMGQDTVMVAPYRDKLYWFWGDTEYASSSLGNLATTGAMSQLPGKGGLDPAVGVDLDYFQRNDGFVRPMLDSLEGGGFKWLFGLMTLTDPAGRERLVARYNRMKDLDVMHECGLVVFDDDAQVFRKLVEFPRNWPIARDPGRPFPVSVKGVDYYYIASPFPAPCIRVRADWEQVQHVENYEAFTCYAPGKGKALDRDAPGALVWDWKRGAMPMSWKEQETLIKDGKLQRDETMWQLRDVDTNEPFEANAGTVCWNEYRKRWIAVLHHFPNAVYFAEADTPLGPWVYAKRVMQHDNYTFYWPAQHPYFDQDGGRTIYFEGTYTDAFSNVQTPTPRYNYNQLMYRLNLGDPRLKLPLPVYRLADGSQRMRDGVSDWSQVKSIAFFALPPENGSMTGELSQVAGKRWDAPQTTLFIDPDANPR
jgi:hypothetical protein